MKDGILYVAVKDQRYLAEAQRSADSVRRVSDLPIALITDIDGDHTPFDAVMLVDAAENIHIEKVKAIVNTPFERTLYLDTDTRTLHPVRGLFDLLDKFDLAAVAEDYIDHDGAPVTLPVFNSGVLVYHIGSVMATFARWLDLVRAAQSKGADQKYLRMALWERPVKVVGLSRNYNFRCDYPWQTWGRVSILHGRRNIDAAAEHVNDSLHLRLWRPSAGGAEVLY